MRNVIVLMTVCEGEYNLAVDALKSLLDSCGNFQLKLVVVDDASESHVGMHLCEWFRSNANQDSYCFSLTSSLGFTGTSRRLCIGMQVIDSLSWDFDFVLKIEADAMVVRRDLGSFLDRHCKFPEGKGLCGIKYGMRPKDALLVLMDMLPIGWRRKKANGVITKKWELARIRPVWWCRFGWSALVKGYRFDYMPCCFLLIGRETLKSLCKNGFVVSTQESSGFVFADDVLLFIAVTSIAHPVIAFSGDSWEGTMGMDESTAWSILEERRPFVLHPLKDRAEAWERRRRARVHLSG